MRKLMLSIVLAVSLGGCATLDFLNPNARSILQGGVSVTASIAQPIGHNEMVAIESAYQAGLVAIANYRRFCYSAALTSLPAFCQDRRRVMTIAQSAVGRARTVMRSLRYFVANNDTVNALVAFNSAKQLVAELTTSVAIQGAP